MTVRRLMNILVACPKDTVHLQLVDISRFDQEIGCMLGFLDDVLKDVDFQNVVQVIRYSTSSWMETAGQQVMEVFDLNFNFLSLCCFNLSFARIMLGYLRSRLWGASS